MPKPRFAILFLFALMGLGLACFHVQAESSSGVKQVYTPDEVPDEKKTGEQLLVEKGVVSDASAETATAGTTTSGTTTSEPASSGNTTSGTATSEPASSGNTTSGTTTSEPASSGNTTSENTALETSSNANVPVVTSQTPQEGSQLPAANSQSPTSQSPTTSAPSPTVFSQPAAQGTAASSAKITETVPTMKAVETPQQVYVPEEIKDEAKTPEQVLMENGKLNTAPLASDGPSDGDTGTKPAPSATSTTTDAGTSAGTPSQGTAETTSVQPSSASAGNSNGGAAGNGTNGSTTASSSGGSSASTTKEAGSDSQVLATEKKSSNSNDLKRMTAQQKLKGPKSLVLYFLEMAQKKRYVEAAWAIDFTNHEDLHDDEREELAYKLDAILIRLDNFHVDDLPEDFERAICVLWPDKQYKSLALIRLEDGTWRFSSSAIAHIPEFYDKIVSKPPVFARYNWLQYIPIWMSNWMFIPVFSLLLIQWLLLLGFILLGGVVVKVLPRLVLVFLRWFFKRANLEQVYQDMIRSALRPLAYLVMLHIWYLGLLFVQASPMVQRSFDEILRPLGIGIVVLSVLRFIDLFGEWWRTKIKQKSLDSTRNLLVGLCDGVLKVLVVCTGGICIAQIFGFSAYGIISGMGIGGIAVALAAQQTLSNFFGSLTILMDQPFTVGDTIIVNNIQGTVESVGLRSTRIRTLEDTRIVMPNSTLASSVINNMGRRTTRRFHLTLSLQYGTPIGLIRAFRVGVRKILESHPLAQKKDILVNIHDLGDSSINIELLCVIKVHDIQQEYAVREALIVDILALAQELGVSMAYPTQTNYMIQTKDLDYPRAAEAETPDAMRELGEKTAAQVLERKKR